MIDYLFTSKPYRGLRFQELGDTKISEYLVDFAIKTATEIDGKVPIRYVALAPAHDNLYLSTKNGDLRGLIRQSGCICGFNRHVAGTPEMVKHTPTIIRSLPVFQTEWRPGIVIPTRNSRKNNGTAVTPWAPTTSGWW